MEIETRMLSQKLDDVEQDFLAQRAKSSHISLSDKCNKYFHSLIKKKKARNIISFIRREDESTTGDINTIVADFVKYYSDLFGKSVSRPPTDFDIFGAGYRLTKEDQELLVYPVSTTEIKGALGDIGNDKAPGPDGYPSAFFK